MKWLLVDDWLTTSTRIANAEKEVTEGDDLAEGYTTVCVREKLSGQ